MVHRCRFSEKDCLCAELGVRLLITLQWYRLLRRLYQVAFELLQVYLYLLLGKTKGKSKGEKGRRGGRRGQGGKASCCRRRRRHQSSSSSSPCALFTKLIFYVSFLSLIQIIYVSDTKHRTSQGRAEEAESPNEDRDEDDEDNDDNTR